jgi:CheY-like chemotaxis protein
MVLLGDVGEMKEVREGAGDGKRCLNRHPCELDRKGFEDIGRAGPCTFGQRTHALDGGVKVVSFDGPQRFAQQLAQQADVVAKRFVRIVCRHFARLTEDCAVAPGGSVIDCRSPSHEEREMLDAFVLVVDDNPETLNLLAQALQDEGIPVRTASSVFRALEALHDGSDHPALIITDLIMPQTTGWDFLKHLRGEPALQSVPVMVVTGTEAGDGEALADVVLQKPVDPIHLAKTVRELLLSKSQPRSA